MDSTEKLEEAVGRAVRLERDEHGLTLDQLATEMRERGVKWTTARVIEFEKGQLRLTLPILLALTQSLRALVGRHYMLSDLIPDDRAWLKLTDTWRTPRHLVREVLDGIPVPLPIVNGDVPDSGPWRHESSVIEDMRVSSDSITATLAEQRAARRIGVRPRQVAMWANMLWGTHLDDEVSRRAGDGASSQARGHVTRLLVDEIKGKIDDHRTHGPSDG